jgi:ADP-ribose pyrophosphatase YjhB (NUDIX family)
MHKIFFHNRLITLDNKIVTGNFATINLEYESSETIKFAIKSIEEREEITQVNIIHSDSDQLLQKAIKALKLIEAAGGLVINERGEFLMIFRNGKWDIPKGKLKRGENPQEGGIREVEEECNVKGLSITGEFLPTYHIYDLKGKKVLKKTYWYKMACIGEQTLTPQTEEGITEVKWFREEEISNILSNTYSSIQEVLKEAMNG